MINPLRTNMVDSLFHFSLSVDVGDWIRHKISLPNVMALMSPKESMVDMMVASNPVIKIPYASGGKTMAPKRG